jgi:hypothetical protein
MWIILNILEGDSVANSFSACGEILIVGQVTMEVVMVCSEAARPALCSRFRADGLQVAVTDDGRVLLGLYGRSGDDKCHIIGMYVELSRCEELEKTRLFQPLRAKDFLESRMHPYLIAGIERLERISDKMAEAFAERHAV